MPEIGFHSSHEPADNDAGGRGRLALRVHLSGEHVLPQIGVDEPAAAVTL